MFDRLQNRRIASTPAGSPETVDPLRVRATLRLLFEGPTADRIAERAGRDAERVPRVAIRQWTLDHWRSRLKREATGAATPAPLSPMKRLPARGAVALAFHLGLGTGGKELAEIAGTSIEQVGADLHRIRLVLAGDGPSACGEQVSTIGRYRDPSLDITQRATLLRHVQGCEACRATLDRFQNLDAHLLEQVEREEAVLVGSPQPPARSTSRFTAARWMVAMVGVAILVTAGIVLLSVRMRADTSTLAAAAHSSNALHGWLLTQEENGQLSALDLATGQRRSLGTPDIQPANLQYGLGSAMLSPDRRLIAGQKPVGNAQPTQALTIATVDGTRLQAIEMADPYSALAGWLGNGTVLEVEQPQPGPGETQTDYSARVASESTVVAVDVTTGAQQEIFRGSVSNVFPSPDSSLVVIRTTRTSAGGQPVIELRPVQDGQIGPAIATVTLGSDSDPVWAADSSRFYVALGPADATARVGTPTSSAAPASQDNSSLRTAAVDRTGAVTPLPAVSGGRPGYPVAISPDGQFLFEVSTSFDAIAGLPSYRLWRVAVSGGEATMVAGPSPVVLNAGVWSPDGQIFMVEDYRPFLIESSYDSRIFGDIWSTSITAIFPDGHTEIQRSQLDSAGRSGLLGWLRDGDVPGALSGKSGGQPGIPQPTDLAPNDLNAEDLGPASFDGKYVVLLDPTDSSPVIWDRSAQTARRLPAGTTDLSWLPQSDQVVAAGTMGSGQPAGPSRIVTFAAAFNGSMPNYDFRFYDPAGIGSGTDKSYARPLFSPNQGALAFFLVDDRTGTIELWVAQYGHRTGAVYRWNVPTDSKISTQPVSAWIDDHTLLFAEPGDWLNGLSRQVQLQRLTIEPDGSTHVDRLTTLRTHGGERGVNLQGLAINQRGQRIAYRLRHFTQPSATNGVFDSVDIVTLAHVASPIELSRQGTDVGMNWSPDGSVLAAAFPGEIRLYSTVGELLAQVSGTVDPASPVWISSSEIWFNATVDGAGRVMSVQVH